MIFTLPPLSIITNIKKNLDKKSYKTIMILMSKSQDYYYKYLKYKKKYINKKNDILFKEDWKKLVPIANRVKIIGVGEASHGQTLITVYRIQLFKKLVETCHYNVFILEDQYSCCQKINHYLKTGIGDPIKLLSKLMWFWHTKNMLDLIIWMRKYNIKHNNILEFYGLDIQYICHNISPNNSINDMVEENNMIDQNNDIVADNFRDKSMYKVFMMIYQQQKQENYPTDRKYFLYMHNYHIAKQDIRYYSKKKQKVKWLGYYLDKNFGPEYYAIGNLFFRGSYLETLDSINDRMSYETHDNNFVEVHNPPFIYGLNPKKLHDGLNIFRPKSKKKQFYDAVIVLDNEYPVKIFD